MKLFVPLLVASASLGLLFAAACGGKTEGPTDRQQSGSRADNEDEAKQPNEQPASAAKGEASLRCAHSSQSGSGGISSGSYQCMTVHEYRCEDGNTRSIRCDCTGSTGGWSAGTCECADTGVTFAYDCASACTLPAETFANCKLPPPPIPPPNNGGSTSSSGG